MASSKGISIKYSRILDMWKQRKFLALIDAETHIHIRKAKQQNRDISELLKNGIDYLWIQTLYPYHGSMFRIVLRKWFGSINDTDIEESKRQIINTEADKLLNYLSPRYIEIRKAGLRKYVRLTYEGEKFVKNPFYYWNVVLEKYGYLVSFITGSGLVALAIWLYNLTI